MTAERPRFPSEPILEEQKRLLDGLIKCGLSFYDTVEELGVYDSAKQRVQDIGQMGVKSDVYSNMWSFEVLSSRLDFPEWEHIYSKCLEWSFGLKTTRKGGIRRRTVEKPDEYNFKLALEGFPNIGDYLDFKMTDASWIMVVQRNIKIGRPLDEIGGKPINSVRERLELRCDNSSGRFWLLNVKRSLLGLYPFNLEAALGYREEEDQKGFLSPTSTSVSWRRALCRSETASADNFLTEEMEKIQQELLDSFPASIDAISLVRVNFGLIVDATDQAVENLRLALIKE